MDGGVYGGGRERETVLREMQKKENETNEEKSKKDVKCPSSTRLCSSPHRLLSS